MFNPGRAGLYSRALAAAASEANQWARPGIKKDAKNPATWRRF